MIVLGINQFIKNIRNSIMPIIQLIAMFFVGIIMFSAYEEQNSLFRGLNGVIDETGRYILSTNVSYGMHNKLKSVDRATYILQHSEKGEENEYYYVYTYDDKIIKYNPAIKKGKSVDEGKPKENVIRIVVTEENPLSKKLGETVEFMEEGEGNSVSNKDVKYMINGVIDSDENLFGINRNLDLTGNQNYLNCYTTERDEFGENSYVILANYEDYINAFKASDGYSCGVVAIFDYEDNITESDIKYNDQILSKEYDIKFKSDMIDCESIYSQSKKMNTVKNAPILVIFLVIFIYSMISLIVTGVLTVIKEKRNYAIYFICGNSWKKSFEISIIHRFVELFLGLIITIGIVFPVKDIVSRWGFNIELSLMVIISILTLFIIMLFITTLGPMLMLRRIEPVVLFRNNEV